ncbi:FAD-dependent monooxygenase [Streptomyces sp. NPDC012888]|uniref:FAD-dependent monooxygenase n=1 Tax=Streptomyces sp. NPDC012888 TaxID=3364855 RepID=UPI0036968E8B
MAKAWDTEVAIVGGGPVGTLLAGELALHGVRTVVLEKLSEPSGISKAGNLHARTAQTLNRRGLLDAVQPGPYAAGNRPQRHVPFHFGGIFDFDLAPVVGEFPALLGVPATYLEEVFAWRAGQLGAEVRRGAEVVTLNDRGDAVELRVRNAQGTESVLRAGWVVGCDGSRSTVRKQADIPFSGTLPTTSCLMGEVLLKDPRAVPAGWHRTERGWTIFWVNPYGYSRVGTYDFRGPHPDRHSPVTLEELRGEAERISGRRVEMSSPRWLARFSDVALQAEQYRKGRVLLAGDAAHVHFPAGGQGLNTGLQDAVNLGWKLAAVVAGHASPDLLDSYHEERHPVAARVIYNVKAQVALMNPDPAADALRELFGELMRMEPVNDHLAGMVSGESIVYDAGRPEDPLAGRFVHDMPLKTAHGPVALAELLHAGRPVLLDLAGRTDLHEVVRPWRGRVHVVAAVPEGDAVDAEALLLRPDGYAAWSTQGPAPDEARGLAESLERWFGAPSATAP